MSTTKHTPGPWIASVGACYDQVEVIDGPLICFATIREESKANARLISAAPELLSALSALLGPAEDPRIGWRGHDPSTKDHFRCEFCREESMDCMQIQHLTTCPVTLARAVQAKAGAA